MSLFPVKFVRLSDLRKWSWISAGSLLFITFNALFPVSSLAEELDGKATVKQTAGVPITYQLPADGELPKTYRVTLAITDPKNPDWIISQFVAGGVRTVTKENAGKFTETWDGLDDNFMPIPPGDYGVKGIYMSAKKWEITGEYHTLIPKVVVGAGDSWFPKREEDTKFPWIYGAGVGYMKAIDVAPGGKAAFYHNYIENSTNPFLLDLNKPIAWDQVLASYGSGGTAGGWSVATDGEMIWCACKDSGSEGISFVYRADGRKFGNGISAYRRDVYIPDGNPSDLAAWRDPVTGKRYLYVAQEAKLQPSSASSTGNTKPTGNKITILDGETAALISTVAITNPQVIQVIDGRELVAMHIDEKGKRVVSAIALKAGLPDGAWRRLCGIAGIEHPAGFAMDSKRNIYISDTEANQVYKLDAQGKILNRFGRMTEQKPGHYDEQVFMSPGCLAIWKDQRGEERLLVVELSGPNRVSEWTPDGKLVRQWSAATFGADSGYAIDPDIPEHLYVATYEPATGSGLIRYKVNYEERTWKVDAVWPTVCCTSGDSATWGNFPGGSARPKIINHLGHKYLAFARTHLDRYGYIVYRQDGDNWIPSAGLIPVGTGNQKDNTQKRIFKQWFWWNDMNGDGKLQEEEYKDRPANLPPGRMGYWGNTWLDDLSLTWVSDNDTTWRITPSDFDKHGNPVFDGKTWQSLLVDTVLRARKEGKATALYGGNELTDKYPGDWQCVDGSMEDGFYVNARGGCFNANYAPQYKISRYVPDGKGGFAMKWRVGRAANGRHRGTALPGEIYGSIFITKPINGILGLQDSTAGLYHLYTDEGMYVDTLFYDDHRMPRNKGGAYSLSGENFGGHNFLNRNNGKVYVAMTSNQPCILYEVDGWSTTENPVNPLKTVQSSVRIASSQIAPPSEHALKIRGGSGSARVAKFQPATGGVPMLDGSMSGWESAEPIRFQADDKQNVEVRCLHDPQNIYLRWQVRLGRPFAAKPLLPVEYIFTHGREADTLSFYIQGNPDAKSGGSAIGRSGDVRIVFGLFEEAGKVMPVALGLYPKWLGDGKPTPITYGSAVGSAPFENVAVLKTVRMGYKIDPDRQCFVLAVSIPRDAIPKLPEVKDELRTMGNFEVTLGGHNKFWWANSDGSISTETWDEPTEARLYPGSWAPLVFAGMGEGLVVRNWQVIGPFGFEGISKLDTAQDRVKVVKAISSTVYPPEDKIDIEAAYKGKLTTIRDIDKHRLAPDRRMSFERVCEAKWTRAALAGPGELRFWEILTNRTDISFSNDMSFYAATWIYAPEVSETKIVVDGPKAGHYGIRGWLNGKRLLSTGKDAECRERIDKEQSVRLNPGWNTLLLRYNHIYGAGAMTVRLDAPPETLWKLKIVGSPPLAE
ncbi:MAG: hypothetical protein WAX69_03920 [Victivallales bacterium]